MHFNTFSVFSLEVSIEAVLLCIEFVSLASTRRSQAGSRALSGGSLFGSNLPSFGFEVRGLTFRCGCAGWNGSAKPAIVLYVLERLPFRIVGTSSIALSRR